MLLLLLIAALVALGFLYGIPALILRLTDRDNRGAAWAVIAWSGFSIAAAFAVFRLFSSLDQNALAVVIILVPAAILDGLAARRIVATPTITPSSARVEPIPHLLWIWAGIYLLHFAWGSIAHPLTGAHLKLPPEQMQLIALGISAVGWLFLGALEWLLLKRVGFEPIWIGATFAAGTLGRFAGRALQNSIGLGVWQIASTSALTAIAVAIAQWACIPARYPRRALWAFALAGAELFSIAIWAFGFDDFLRFPWPADRILDALLSLFVGAIAGLAMRHILSLEKADASAPDSSISAG